MTGSSGPKAFIINYKRSGEQIKDTCRADLSLDCCPRKSQWMFTGPEWLASHNVSITRFTVKHLTRSFCWYAMIFFQNADSGTSGSPYLCVWSCLNFCLPLSSLAFSSFSPSSPLWTQMNEIQAIQELERWPGFVPNYANEYLHHSTTVENSFLFQCIIILRIFKWGLGFLALQRLLERDNSGTFKSKGMLNIGQHQENTNQNHTEKPPHTSQSG